ncbi:hypothetical protein MTP99_012345 [Tenebrio molitor]|nr:hypothetical protein MTP99_012345 [Tenebrio molitor]
MTYSCGWVHLKKIEESCSPELSPSYYCLLSSDTLCSMFYSVVNMQPVGDKLKYFGEYQEDHSLTISLEN